MLDDVDIYKVDLARHRSRITIIPQVEELRTTDDALFVVRHASFQEPALFNGSLRFNLDPCGRHSDTHIWDVLRSCGLADFVRQFPEGLDLSVDSDGAALSEGERQTICCIRGMLSSVARYIAHR